MSHFNVCHRRSEAVVSMPSAQIIDTSTPSSAFVKNPPSIEERFIKLKEDLEASLRIYQQNLLIRSKLPTEVNKMCVN